MSDFESYERRIREEAERKIETGRGLQEAAAAVLAAHNAYRDSVDAARSAGWDEQELARFGLLVDGVRLTAKPGPKTGTKKIGIKPRASAGKAPANAPTAPAPAPEATTAAEQPATTDSTSVAPATPAAAPA